MDVVMQRPEIVEFGRAEKLAKRAGDRRHFNPGLILLGQITAIGNNDCPRCICRGLRSEEQDGADHFRRLSESPHGNLFYQAGIDFFRSPEFLRQRRFQVVRRDGIDPDLVSGPFKREAFGQ